MKTPGRPALNALVAALALLPAGAAADGPKPTPAPGVETLETADGARTVGLVGGDPTAGFEFRPNGSGPPVALAPGMTVFRDGRAPTPALGLPPFRVELGLGQRVSGRLGALDGREVKFLDAAGDGPVTVARTGVRSLVQRPGEIQVFQDGFESLDADRWSITGDPGTTASDKVAGAKSLRLPAGGCSLTHRLREPFESGRLEVAFHDDGVLLAGRQWFADLTFRGATGPETVRVVMGWSEESLAVESPGGPALAVQRLARKVGWHRLVVRFGPDRSEVSVDENELAHGKGFGGPLVEVRLASVASGAVDDEEPPRGLAGRLDDLRLVRYAEPVSDLETDPTQDEVRTAGGDQLFGAVRAATAESVVLSIEGREVSLPWSEVSGLHFRRDASPGAPVEGLLVRVDWRAAPGDDPRDRNSVEGALTGLSASRLEVATPYAGTLNVPRDRVTSVRVVGRGRRVVVDATAHHLGDEISTTPPLLDPPQPEGGVLERPVVLAAVPPGRAWLVLDVVQVVGEAADLPFSNLVKKGELRTNVKINGEPFDYLNHYITSRNETPERLRLAVPPGLLKPGKNVVRFELAGVASDPNFLDDMGLLTVALEFDAPAAGAKPR